MEVRISNFHGHGARQAKARVYRHFRNIPRQNWHYSENLDECSGAATFRGAYVAAAWTGRYHEGITFPLWLWRRVAAIKHRPLSDWLIVKMKKLGGVR